jgi:hypothetical protein
MVASITKLAKSVEKFSKITGCVKGCQENLNDNMYVVPFFNSEKMILFKLSGSETVKKSSQTIYDDICLSFYFFTHATHS